MFHLMNQSLLPALFLLGMAWKASATEVRPLKPDTLLNEAPIFLSHDAATGYLVNPGFLRDPLAGYAKTQNATFTGQLNCGARAFDLRPAWINETVFFNHGPQKIVSISFIEGVTEILDWSAADSTNDLILLKVVNCDGPDICDEQIQTDLNNLGVPFFQDCTKLSTLTVGEAQAQGNVVAFNETCFVQNYNSHLNCHGFTDNHNETHVQAVRECVEAGFDEEGLRTTWACLERTLNPELVTTFNCWFNQLPWTRLRDYLLTTANAGPPSNGYLWQWQALWQQTVDSVTLGIMQPYPPFPTLGEWAPSTILNDIQKSELNCKVLDTAKTLVEEGVVLNLVESDGVCSPCGRQIMSAIRQ